MILALDGIIPCQPKSPKGCPSGCHSFHPQNSVGKKVILRAMTLVVYPTIALMIGMQTIIHQETASFPLVSSDSSSVDHKHIAEKFWLLRIENNNQSKHTQSTLMPYIPCSGRSSVGSGLTSDLKNNTGITHTTVVFCLELRKTKQWSWDVFG